ncbi:hypothetical protein QJS66_11905 [Kocuria rhizophila]|nr:hypothetical protein QJS66_11905 [Kocuria rhizophila]
MSSCCDDGIRDLLALGDPPLGAGQWRAPPGDRPGLEAGVSSSGTSDGVVWGRVPPGTRPLWCGGVLPVPRRGRDPEADLASLWEKRRPVLARSRRCSAQARGLRVVPGAGALAGGSTSRWSRVSCP